MSIQSTLIDLGIVMVIAGAAFSIGYVKGDAAGVASETPKVLAAQHAVQTARDNAAEANQALAILRTQLAGQKQTLLDAQQTAAAALDQRDRLQTQLAQATRARIAAERKTVHDTPDCSDLAHLPICPALARRLFEQPASTNGRAPGTVNDH